MSIDRADRAGQVAAERRRRVDGEVTKRLNLVIPEEVRARLAAEGRTPRWVNDTGSRVADLTTRDDYDPVEGVEPVKVDTDKDGKPVYARLFAKPTDFIERGSQRKRTTSERMSKPECRRANLRQSGEVQQIQGQMGAPVYVDPASKIGRANQVLD
jgi:hypothetical protein